MMMTTYLNAFQIGVIAGMRALTAPALVSYKLSNTHPDPLANSKLDFLHSPTTATVLKVLAGGELIGDKLPQSPDRIGAAQLPVRILSGAVSGAAISEAEGESVPYGALAGALGAVASSFAFFHLRHWLTAGKGLPDPAIALVEDALAIGLGLLVMRHVEPALHLQEPAATA